MKCWPFVALLTIIVACDSTTESSPIAQPVAEQTPRLFDFAIAELSDEQYPDNPDIGFRSEDYRNALFDSGSLELGFDTQAHELGDITPARLTFRTEAGDSIVFPNFSLQEFIPTVPMRVRDDAALTRIALVNQEWNRNQVRFSPAAFETNLPGIVRADVARNCLNACLWEVALYVEESGKTVPWAHGWFDFPHQVYVDLIEAHNAVDYAEFSEALENWQDPGRLPVNMDVLREVRDTVHLQGWADLSDAMYPVGGAREKKFKEIITPVSFQTMRDLQSDSTTFATFTPPGFYNRMDPRTTELGRFQQLLDATCVTSVSEGKVGHELHLNFSGDDRETQLVFGGLQLSAFVKASEEDVNGLWRTSMGIGNHPFYESAADHEALHAFENPYFGMLLDAQGRWLDSHDIGIDGPIFHWDEHVEGRLHLWLLSFERHALVGHYTFDFPTLNAES